MRSMSGVAEIESEVAANDIRIASCGVDVEPCPVATAAMLIDRDMGGVDVVDDTSDVACKALIIDRSTSCVSVSDSAAALNSLARATDTSSGVELTDAMVDTNSYIIPRSTSGVEV